MATVTGIVAAPNVAYRTVVRGEVTDQDLVGTVKMLVEGAAPGFEPWEHACFHQVIADKPTGVIRFDVSGQKVAAPKEVPNGAEIIKR